MKEGCYLLSRERDPGLGRGYLAASRFPNLTEGARAYFPDTKSFEQGPAIDHNETLVSIVKPMSYQPIFAFSAVYDHEMAQKGDQTAFLQGDVVD